MKNSKKNKYYKRSHISEKKFRELLRYFCLDLDAKQTSHLTGISHRSCKVIYTKLRLHIVKYYANDHPDSGEFEVDESYFGAKRVRGKRGGNLYVQVVENCKKEQLIPIINGKIIEGSTIHTHGWKAYDGLVVNGYDHYRVFHSHDEFARGKSHINGIESFWSFTKRRLSKFNELSDQTFYLHLKECEFRFNHRHDNLYLILLIKFRKHRF